PASPSLVSTLNAHSTDVAKESATARRSVSSLLRARKRWFGSTRSTFGPTRSKRTMRDWPISFRSRPIGFEPTPPGSDVTLIISSPSRAIRMYSFPASASQKSGRKPSIVCIFAVFAAMSLRGAGGAGGGDGGATGAEAQADNSRRVAAIDLIQAPKPGNEGGQPAQ